MNDHLVMKLTKDYLSNQREEEEISQISQFLSNLSEDLQAQARMEMNFHEIKRIPLLKVNFSHLFLSSLAYSFKEKIYKRGEVIFDIDENPDKFFILLKGKIDLTLSSNSSSRQGKNHIIDEVRDGEPIGQEDFIRQRARKSKATAKSDCLLSYCSFNEFISTLDKNQIDKEQYFALKDALNLYNSFNSTLQNSTDKFSCLMGYQGNRDRVIVQAQSSKIQRRDSSVIRIKPQKFKTICKSTLIKEKAFKYIIDTIHNQIKKQSQHQNVRNYNICLSNEIKENLNYSYAIEKEVELEMIPISYILEEQFSFLQEINRQNFHKDKNIITSSNEISFKDHSTQQLQSHLSPKISMTSIHQSFQFNSDSDIQSQDLFLSPEKQLTKISHQFLKNQSYNDIIQNRPFAIKYKCDVNSVAEIASQTQLETIVEQKESTMISFNTGNGDQSSINETQEKKSNSPKPKFSWADQKNIDKKLHGSPEKGFQNRYFFNSFQNSQSNDEEFSQKSLKDDIEPDNGKKKLSSRSKQQHKLSALNLNVFKNNNQPSSQNPNYIFLNKQMLEDFIKQEHQKEENFIISDGDKFIQIEDFDQYCNFRIYFPHNNQNVVLSTSSSKHKNISIFNRSLILKIKSQEKLDYQNEFQSLKISNLDKQQNGEMDKNMSISKKINDNNFAMNSTLHSVRSPTAKFINSDTSLLFKKKRAKFLDQ